MSGTGRSAGKEGPSGNDKAHLMTSTRTLSDHRVRQSTISFGAGEGIGAAVEIVGMRSWD